MYTFENDSLFTRAVADVLKHEGGYVDHPNDPGGATNHGISLRFYRRIKPGATAKDIKALTRKDAMQIYYDHWWVRYSYAQLPFSIGKRVFSFSVNMPTKQAHIILQRALRAATGENLVLDGVIGPKTLAAVKGSYHGQLLAALRSEAAAYYRLLAQRRPSMKVFLKGWLNRAYS
jgi:lysozyme family protein